MKYALTLLICLFLYLLYQVLHSTGTLSPRLQFLEKPNHVNWVKEDYYDFTVVIWKNGSIKYFKDYPLVTKPEIDSLKKEETEYFNRFKDTY